MYDLLECETEYVRASEVVALFCCQVKKWIGAFTVGPGRVDALVSAGGIGENASMVCRILRLITKKEHDRENDKGV